MVTLKVGIVIDVSAWQGDISVAQFQQAKADLDLKGVIVQLWGGIPGGLGPRMGANEFAAKQLQNALGADLPVAGYAWVPPDNVVETNQLVAVVLEAAGPQLPHLRFIAPDIEGSRLLHPTHPVARLGNFMDNTERQWKRPSHGNPTYTSLYMWQVCMQNTSAFCEDPVWAADYDGDDDLATTLLPDGWTMDRLAGKQFAGTTMVAAGFDCDLNVFDLKYFGYEDDPCADLRAEIEGLKEKLREVEQANLVHRATRQGVAGHLERLARDLRGT